MIKGSVLDIEDPQAVISDLTTGLIGPDNRLRLLPAEEYRSIPHDHLRAWCGATARYGIPTLELIQWLQNEIGDLKAIEVAAGMGDLGYHLGIPMTDSYLQQSPEMQFMYGLIQQVGTQPPPDVKKLHAITAISQLKPKVVVASWLTRKFIRGKDKDGVAQASVFGPEEEKILKGCRKYIHIGNDNIHSQKTILALPHRKLYFPWLVSRAEDQSKNCIYVWER